MSFIDAVRSALTKYATFSGRARRSEYWWFVLFNSIVTVLALVADGALGFADTGEPGPVFTVAVLALLLPGLAVTARRLHDTGRSGWWILLSFVPFGGLVLFFFTLLDSQGPNAWGDSPKAFNPRLA